MDIRAAENYICEKKRIEMPDFQERFALTYSDTVKALTELEKAGKIKYCDGLSYESNMKKTEPQTSTGIYIPKDKQEETFIKALWECIKHGSASISVIRYKCSIGFSDSARALNWMEEKGFIAPTDRPSPRPILISKEDFIKKFGNSYDDSFLSEENFMERHRKLMESLSQMDNDDEEDDDDDDKDEEDNDCDIDKAVKERIDYLEKRRQEILERIRQAKENLEDCADKEDHGNLAADLRTEIQRMPDYNADDDTFTIKMEVKYPDGTPFRIKVIEKDNRYYLSDLGDTFKYLSAFNDKYALAKFFEDTLKTENLCFIEDAVCTIIDDIHDLSAEAAFLFKVVNGLITQEYFDMYYLGEECIKLANSILQEDDAAMLVNAISVLDKKRVRVTVLQKQLNVERSRANRIINTLMKLGVISFNKIKSDKISNGFIAYLKRMLDNKNGV